MQPAHFFPDQLDAGHVQLRRYQAANAAGVLQLIERNRERLRRNFPELANGVKAIAAASAYLAASDKQWADRAAFVYGIWSPSELHPIGQLRIKNMTWDVPSAELSYFVDRRWLRRGVATGAVRAVLREAFDERGFRRVYVRIIGANEESLALARRLQLRHEGVHRNSFRCGLGELHDVHLFAMTDADYRSNTRG